MDRPVSESTRQLLEGLVNSFIYDRPTRWKTSEHDAWVKWAETQPWWGNRSPEQELFGNLTEVQAAEAIDFVMHLLGLEWKDIVVLQAFTVE